MNTLPALLGNIRHVGEPTFIFRQRAVRKLCDHNAAIVGGVIEPAAKLPLCPDVRMLGCTHFDDLSMKQLGTPRPQWVWELGELLDSHQLGGRGHKKLLY